MGAVQAVLAPREKGPTIEHREGRFRVQGDRQLQPLGGALLPGVDVELARGGTQDQRDLRHG